MEIQEILNLILTEVRDIKEGQKRLEKRIDSLEQRMDRLETEVKSNFKETQQQLVKVVEELGNNSRMVTLEKVVAVNCFEIEKLKTKVG